MVHSKPGQPQSVGNMNFLVLISFILVYFLTLFTPHSILTYSQFIPVLLSILKCACISPFSLEH